MTASVSFDILSEAMPGELELLLRAIRLSEGCENDPKEVSEIQRLAGQSPDWDYLARLAARHHVTPLLYLGLKRTAWPLLPEAAKSTLTETYRGNLKRNLRLAHHASRVVKAFGQQGLRIIPFKGIFLAQSVYGRISSREVNDIDLLIDHGDAMRGRELLESMGFESVERLDQEQVFRNRSWQVEIDLHWQLTPKYFPVEFDFDQLWRRSIRAEVGGVGYGCLAGEDLLLLLCIQVAKDSWERLQRLEQLQKVSDIAVLINHTPGLNWAAVFESASEQGLSRVLRLPLLLSARLLGCRLPRAAADYVEKDRTALSLTRQVSNIQSLAGTDPAPGSNSLLDVSLRLRQLVFYLKLRERQVDKWRHIGRVLRAPTVMAKTR